MLFSPYLAVYLYTYLWWFLCSSKYENKIKLFQSFLDSFETYLFYQKCENYELQIVQGVSHIFPDCGTLFSNFRPQFRHRQNAVGLGLGDHVSTPLSLLTATINVSFPDRATKPSAEIQTFLIAILAFYFAFGVTLWYNYFKYLFLVFSCFSLVWETKEGKLRNMIFTHHNK